MPLPRHQFSRTVYLVFKGVPKDTYEAGADTYSPSSCCPAPRACATFCVLLKASVPHDHSLARGGGVQGKEAGSPVPGAGSRKPGSTGSKLGERETCPYVDRAKAGQVGNLRRCKERRNERNRGKEERKKE